LTFASARTNVLLGAVHLLLFLAYLMLIFEKEGESSGEDCERGRGYK